MHIEPAYADLVRKHTRFWNASGISISGGLSGFKVHSESLLTLVAGGIAFSTPENRTLFPGYPEGYYENHFLHSFELEDGKIKRNREFMNVFQQLRALSIPVPEIKREGIPT